MKKIAVLLILILPFTTSFATNYYVSTTGNDLDDGLTTGTAWATFDNGDASKTNVLVPGDTVFVMEGTYLFEGEYKLTSSGSAGLPITYTSYLGEKVVLDANATNNIILTLEGSNTIIDGFVIRNTANNGIYDKADTCVVKNCLIRNIGGIAVRVEGSDCQFYNNRIKNPNDEGIKNEGSGDNNLYYNNTIVECGTNGLELKSNTCRVINNIIAYCKDGIRGGSSEHASFNCVWNNTDADYTGGVVDSAGGISADPLFVDLSSANFSLRWNSPAIDAGIDLGLSYEGSSPDMGAVEYIPHTPQSYYVSTTGDNLNDGLTESTPWATIDNGELNGYLAPGDTVTIFEGSYTIGSKIILTTPGTASLPIVYQAFDSREVIIDAGGVVDTVIQITGNHTQISGLTLINSGGDGFSLDADSCFILNNAVYDYIYQGVDISGDDNYIFKNTLFRTTQSGVTIRSGAENNKIYSNTIQSTPYQGVWISSTVNSTQIFNNNIMFAGNGIDCPPGNVCGYNNIYNSDGSSYVNGASDAGGGISVPPLFVDTINYNFNLRYNSLCIDAGTDLSYSYEGAAPDMGAFEFPTHSPRSFYVSTSGNNKYSGVSPDSAWLTIDNGEKNGFILPGDTVRVMAGKYIISELILQTNGTAALPITYLGAGMDSTFLQGSSVTLALVSLNGNHNIFSKMSLIDGQWDGVWVLGDSCIVSECYISNMNADGIDIGGSNSSLTGSQVIKNIISTCGESGIENDWTVRRTKIYGNTVYNNTDAAILLSELSGTARVINNIVAFNADAGITGVWNNICAFNNVYDDWYDGGIYDSAGGISENPFFVDTSAGNFNLNSVSTSIDAGLDLGYPYLGSAPDMGALEYTSQAPNFAAIDSQTVDENQNLIFKVYAIDPDGVVPVLSAENIPANASFIDNGDSSGTFDFTPDFTQAGYYDVTFIASDGAMADTIVVTVSVQNVNQAVTLAAIGAQSVEEGQNLNLTINASDADATIPTIDVKNIPANATFIDNNDGTGTFDFTPAYNQEGLDTMLVIATDGELADSEYVEITVTPAPVTYLEISPATNIVETLDSFQYVANGYDAGSTFVKLLTDSVIWATDDPGGSISTSGMYTAGAVLGNYIVDVSYNSMFDTADVEVITNGAVSYVQIEYLDGSLVDDTTLSVDNDSTTFYCRAYAIGDVLIGDVAVTWDLIGDPIATIPVAPKENVRLNMIKFGTARIIVSHASGAVDTTGVITATPGVPVSIAIEPDTLTIPTDTTQTFTFIGHDEDGNESILGIVPNWSVSNGIGTIDTSGLFTPVSVGTGRVIVESGRLADTTGDITVVPGELDYIHVEPRTALLSIGDSLQFTSTGYDNLDIETDNGVISWNVIGSSGNIDSTGLFTATDIGFCRVAATSSINGISDTSGFIEIQSLMITELPIGNLEVQPGAAFVPILAFRLENFYDHDKAIQGIIIDDTSKGHGTIGEIASAIDSITLYCDSNGDGYFEPSDTRIASIGYTSESNLIVFSPYTIPAYTQKTFFFAISASQLLHDGDSLDVHFHPATDLFIEDGTAVVGEYDINSLGYGIINGLIASQLTLTPINDSVFTDFDLSYNVLTVDIPRNGYHPDTLLSLSVVNLGTSAVTDYDSICVHVDNGDSICNFMDDTFLGKLIYTGDRWELSGINYELSDPSTRFYVSVRINEFPSNNKTLIMTIPQNGIEMISSNDGPYDQAPEPVDTFTIISNEAVSITTIPTGSTEVIPGQTTSPLLNIAFNNSYAYPIAFDSLIIKYDGIDPDGATQSQLDNQISKVRLYRQTDINHDQIGVADIFIAETTLVNGTAVFNTPGLSINGNGGRIVLSVIADVDLQNAKNGNTITFSITDSMSLFTSPAISMNGTFPLMNDGVASINRFPAAAVTVNPVAGKTIFGGQRSQLVLDFELPPNGYAVDYLSSIRIMNIGSQVDANVVSSVKLWTDTDNNGFTPTDELLGSFTRVLDYWMLNGLNRLIPQNGKRFFITIDIIDKNFEGGTIQYIIPENGCTFTSGMVGPDDTFIQNPEAHVVFPSDRITVISIPDSEDLVPPGTKNVNLLTFALYNGYSDRNQTLQSLTFTNKSRSGSTMDYSDYELGFVSVYHNSTGTAVVSNETPSASGRFINGEMQFSGLNVVLPTEEITYFYVQSNFPLDQIDADSLAIAIESSADFIFTEDVNINGVLPLNRGSYIIIDGSISGQYQQYPVAPVTLSPGDTSVVMFAFSPAKNGNISDYLDSLVIRNSADADDTDIDRLELWTDSDGDDIWQSSDSLIGEFVYSSGQWQLGGLNIAVDSIPPTLFVSADIAVGATPDRFFNAVLPVMGCLYQSENDGPLDKQLTGEHTFSISSSLLRVENIPVKNRYSIGETMEIRFKATNLSATPLTNVLGLINYISDSTAVTADSAVNSPVSLNPGENHEFIYFYTADSAASVIWQVYAVAQDINDTSAVISTPSLQIQYSPENVPVVLINSMPTSVTKGQKNLFPLSIKVSHPNNSGNSAAVRLDSLFLTVENSLGQSQLASDIFDRVVFTAGYTNLEIIETVPAVSVIPIYFENPVIIEPDEEQYFSLLVDIDSNATAANFVLSLTSAADIPIVDDNNNQPVSIDSLTNFPLKTASCRIDSPSYEMKLSYNPIISENANFGQNSFPMIELKLNHPGLSSSSQIQLSSLSFEILDDSDIPVQISSVFEKLQVRKQQLLIAEQTTGLDTVFVNIGLSSPVTLNPGELDSIIIFGDIRPDAMVNSFKLRIADSTAFEVRDLSSGSEITVVSDIDTLITNNLFPIVTTSASLKFPADAPEFCIDTTTNYSVIAGQDTVQIADISIVYPFTGSYSSVLLTAIDLYLLDSSQSPLDPTQLFDKIGYVVDNGSVSYQAFIKLSSGAALFEFGPAGLLINPGDSLTIDLIADIEADAGYDHYLFKINNPAAVHFVDQTDTTNKPILQIMFGCDNSFPIQSSITSIISPAGRPLLEKNISYLKNTFGGQDNVELFSGKIHYTGQVQQGDLGLNSLIGSMFKRNSSTFSPEPAGTVFENIRLLIDEVEIAVDSNALTDSVYLIPDSLFTISNGSTVNLSIVGDIKENAPVGNYRFEFSDSSLFRFEDIQLSTQLYPLLMSGAYPLYSNELAVSVTDLEESFVNYPNPFFDETTILFVLPEDGYVDLELFTITGESVKKLVENEFRIADGYDIDKWYGKNAKELPVLPGTYFCRLTVRYDSGSEETVMRKISIVR